MDFCTCQSGIPLQPPIVWHLAQVTCAMRSNGQASWRQGFVCLVTTLVSTHLTWQLLTRMFEVEAGMIAISVIHI